MDHKAWPDREHSSSSSASMVIITGTFPAEDEAIQAERLLIEATEIARRDHADGLLTYGATPNRFSAGMLAWFRHADVPFCSADPEELLYEYRAIREGARLTLEAKGLGLNALIKVLLVGGARVEIVAGRGYAGP